MPITAKKRKPAKRKAAKKTYSPQGREEDRAPQRRPQDEESGKAQSTARKKKKVAPAVPM